MNRVTDSEVQVLRRAVQHLELQPEREWFDPVLEQFYRLLHDLNVDPDFWSSSVETQLYTARTIEEYVDFVRLLGGGGVTPTG